MIYIITSVVLVVASILATILIIHHNDKINNKIISTSEKIKKLLALNKSIEFNNVKSNFHIEKHYDNKRNFNKIEPAFLMTAELKSNINYYSNYCDKIIENKRKLIKYKEEIDKIILTTFLINYNELDITEKQYKKREKKLFSNEILDPVIDCSFNVLMTYSSPQGQVNLEKEKQFNFNDLFACLESISRSRLDRSTYDKLIAVERGEISDSLRYDILKRDNFKCVLCGASVEQGAKLHIDHIIPVSKGGKSIPSNLQTLCERCNIGKADKIETAETKKVNTDNESICKLCGARLVLRKGKYSNFYGCSNYPKCKYTKKITGQN